MATAQQDATGRWTIKVKHNIPGLTVSGVKFTYDNKSVTFDITNSYNEIQTEWETPVGTPINLNQITREYPTFTIGNTIYKPSSQDNIQINEWQEQ